MVFLLGIWNQAKPYYFQLELKKLRLEDSGILVGYWIGLILLLGKNMKH